MKIDKEFGSNAFGIACEIGAGVLVGTVAGAYACANANPLGRAAISIGAFALGGVAGKAANEWGQEWMNGMIECCESVQNKIQKKEA